MWTRTSIFFLKIILPTPHATCLPFFLKNKSDRRCYLINHVYPSTRLQHQYKVPIPIRKSLVFCMKIGHPLPFSIQVHWEGDRVSEGLFCTPGIKSGVWSHIQKSSVTNRRVEIWFEPIRGKGTPRKDTMQISLNIYMHFFNVRCVWGYILLNVYEC